MQLKTYGGRPDDALMALLGGEEMLTSSMNASQDVDTSSSPMDSQGPPQMLQDGRVNQSQSLPDIGVRPGSREAAAQPAYDEDEQGQGQPSMDQYGGYGVRQELSAIDVHLIRLEDLRRQQNEELLVSLEPFFAASV